MTNSPSLYSLILDTDMGADCDDAGALSMLHRLADAGEIQPLAVIFSSGRMPWGAGVCDAINHEHGRPDLAVGAYKRPDIGENVDKIAATEIAQDTARYGHRLRHTDDARDALEVCRSALSSQPDGSVKIVAIGHLKALYDLLNSPPDQYRPLIGPGAGGRQGGRVRCHGRSVPRLRGRAGVEFRRMRLGSVDGKCVA